MTVDLSAYNNFDAMSSETGQQVAFTAGPLLPTIRIETDFDEANDKVRPGLFYVEEQVDEVRTRWYFSKFEIRPFVNAFQYRRYHATDRNKSNRSIIIKNMREEAIDEKGGLKCGKLTSKELAVLPEAERKRLSENVNIFRIVMGTASFNAFNKEGVERKFVDMKVQLQLRGSNFMPINDVFAAITKNKKLLYNHVLSVTNTRHKNGSVTYYELKYACDFSAVVVFAAADIETLTYFNDIIKRVNDQVKEQFNLALRARSTAGSSVPVAKPAIDPELDDPLDDLIGEAA